MARATRAPYDALALSRPLGALLAITLVAGTVAWPAGSVAAPPKQFAPRVDNPWFPLTPGTTFVYQGVKDGKQARDVVSVTRRTRVIEGVRCTVLDDRLYLGGRLAERTTDWYAQDRAGTVWYFGEQTAELDAKGRVITTEGTWRAGLSGAQAGIYMPAQPYVGQQGSQEHYAGHAEDRFQVLSLHAAVSTRGARSRGALLMKEWTPLEPDVVDHKLYVRGIGLVKEETVRGPIERLSLVSVTRG